MFGLAWSFLRVMRFVGVLACKKFDFGTHGVYMVANEQNSGGRSWVKKDQGFVFLPQMMAHFRGGADEES
jgi:hypothetical protein